MNLDITEEEREFLERICTRAEMFVRINLFRNKPSTALLLEKDLNGVVSLKEKFRALDANLINKAIHNENN